MGVETGAPAGIGGVGWYRNSATVPCGSAVKRPGCRERKRVSFIEHLLGCQTSLCLILLFFSSSISFGNSAHATCVSGGKHPFLVGTEDLQLFQASGDQAERIQDKVQASAGPRDCPVRRGARKDRDAT